MQFESVSLPTLKVGDKVRAYGFLAEVVERRDYPRIVDGRKYGSDDRPCSQIDLELIEADDDYARRTFRFLCEPRKGRPNHAMLQGNMLYKMQKLVEA